MRILVVGAGIGGMTLAALLDRRGVGVTLVERAPSFEHAGYMLGLYSLGYRVLHGLGLFERFTEISVESKSYEAHDDHGALIKRWQMDAFTNLLGPILTSTRPQLIELLRGGLGNTAVRFATSVEAVAETDGEVRVRLSDGSHDAFDLVVGADGIHSQVRTLVFGEQPTFDTGWGGWVWWAPSSSLAPETFAEYWGAGRFLGAYPTRRGVGIFAGAPLDGAFESAGPGRGDNLRQRFGGLGDRVDSFLAALPDDGAEMFFWKLSDVRAQEWTRGRVVLLGDAAAGFLPTAGIGASMAMESAAVLADELSRTDKRSLPHALALYVKRRQKRVERIQDDSRKLAKMMFVRSRTMASLRNLATRFYSLEGLAKSIAKSFDQPI